MNESGHLRDATEQGQGPAFQPATPELRQTHDDILRVLADFQLGLESLKTLHAQRVELQERLREREAQLAQRDAHLEAQLAQARKVQDDHGVRERELTGRVAELERRLEEALAAGTSAAGEADRARAAAEQELARTKEAAAAEQESLRHGLAGLQAELASARDDRAGLEQIVLELRAKLKADGAERAQAQDAAAQAEGARAAAVQELARAKEAAADADARLRDLTARLAQAQAQAAALREQLERARQTPASKSRVEQFNARRRARLRLYRAALRDRATRLRKGGDALAKRYEQVEQVLRQRAELAAVRDRVISADRALQKSRARGRAAVTSLAVVGTIAILAALSWAVARQVAPATFVGEVALKADGRGRDLNPAELDEWLRFHQEALNDPRFQEAAAERFARVGRADLGTAAAVAQLVTTSVTTDSILPGELKLQVRYTGRDQARRTTEVLGAALASFANAAQQRRIDGGATLVPNPAAADDQPIDNTQTFYALGFLAAGMLLMTVVGTAVWKKLASVKSAFEQDATLAAVLDEARWADAARP